MSKNTKKLGILLSYALRHNPSEFNLNICDKGWVMVSEILENMKFLKPTLIDLVESDDKGRFEFDELNSKIRATQGHSIKVNLDLEEVKPPEFLYHGTSIKYIDSILEKGINKMSRNHVHLSSDKLTAEKVGSRRGKFKLLKVSSLEMYNDDVKFFISNNGVYLTDNVESKYISILEEE